MRSYGVADLSGNLVEVHRSKDTEPTFLSLVFEFIPLHILDQFGCAGSVVSAFDVAYSSSCSSLDSLKLIAGCFLGNEVGIFIPLLSGLQFLSEVFQNWYLGHGSVV